MLSPTGDSDPGKVYLRVGADVRKGWLSSQNFTKMSKFEVADEDEEENRGTTLKDIDRRTERSNVSSSNGTLELIDYLDPVQRLKEK